MESGPLPSSIWTNRSPTRISIVKRTASRPFSRSTVYQLAITSPFSCSAPFRWWWASWPHQRLAPPTYPNLDVAYQEGPIWGVQLQVLNCGLQREITTFGQGLEVGLFRLLERLFGEVHGRRLVRPHDQPGSAAFDGE